MSDVQGGEGGEYVQSGEVEAAVSDVQGGEVVQCG
jgi:hypothetical protein